MSSTDAHSGHYIIFKICMKYIYNMLFTGWEVRTGKGKIITIINFLVCFAKGTWLKMRFAKNSVFDNI